MKGLREWLEDWAVGLLAVAMAALGVIWVGIGLAAGLARAL